MFYGRRILDIPDGKPKWTGLNNGSELMEEAVTPRQEQESEELESKKRKLSEREDTSTAKENGQKTEEQL